VINSFLNGFFEALKPGATGTLCTTFARDVVPPMAVPEVDNQYFAALASNNAPLTIAMLGERILDFLLNEWPKLASSAIYRAPVNRRFKLRIRAISKPGTVIVPNINWDI